ncbi:MAG: hypothetical protein AAGI17_08015 [Planctomycetota bacterium]
MNDHEFVADALSASSTQSVSLLRAARLIDDRRSEEGIYLLEEVASAPRPPREGLARHVEEAFNGAEDLTLGGIAALLADMIARTPSANLSDVHEDLWEDIGESPHLQGRDADRLILRTVLTRCLDARLAQRAPAAA